MCQLFPHMFCALMSYALFNGPPCSRTHGLRQQSRPPPQAFLCSCPDTCAGTLSQGKCTAIAVTSGGSSRCCTGSELRGLLSIVKMLGIGLAHVRHVAMLPHVPSRRCVDNAGKEQMCSVTISGVHPARLSRGANPNRATPSTSCSMSSQSSFCCSLPSCLHLQNR